MSLGAQAVLKGIGTGLCALILVSCANRFPEQKDPLEDYYASRPHYQENSNPANSRPWTSSSGASSGSGPLPIPAVNSHSSETMTENSDEQGGAHQGASSITPPSPPEIQAQTQPLAGDHKPVTMNGVAPVVAIQGTGNFKKFGNPEAAEIREGIFGKNKPKQFADFEPMVERMMDLKRGTKDIHTVSTQSQEIVKTKFNMNDKLFCEDFTLEDTRIPSFYSKNSSLKGRWEGPDGKKAIAEMQRVNRAHNRLLRDFKTATSAKDEAKIASLNQENIAYWKTFMSCLAYSESGIFWDRDDSKRWLSNWNDYGVYQLNPDQRAGGNLNDCAENWNQEFPEQKIDLKKFRASAEYRKALVTTSNQQFNIFCGLSKVQQNLAHQAKKTEGCLNPFKKSYNHFGALMQNSDLNFLRCTSKLIPSAGASTSPSDALETLRNPGTNIKAEKSSSNH